MKYANKLIIIILSCLVVALSIYTFLSLQQSYLQKETFELEKARAKDELDSQKIDEYVGQADFLKETIQNRYEIKIREKNIKYFVETGKELDLSDEDKKQIEKEAIKEVADSFIDKVVTKINQKDFKSDFKADRWTKSITHEAIQGKLGDYANRLIEKCAEVQIDCIVHGLSDKQDSFMVGCVKGGKVTTTDCNFETISNLAKQIGLVSIDKNRYSLLHLIKKDEPVIEEKKEVVKETIKAPKTLKIFFTSYNAEKGQTDNSPCQGAWGNVCEYSKQGQKVVALSRDLIWGKSNGYCTKNCFVQYGDKIKLESDIPQCNFEALVVDTMNIRYKNRGDIFMMDRKDNTSCTATISKV